MKVYNLESTNGNKVANQFKIIDKEIVVFQSYESTILTIDKEHCIIRVGEDYGYSRTTAKYTRIFLNEVFYNSFVDDVLTAIKKHDDYVDMWTIIYE